jgi:predicted phosphodiesterase
MSYNVMTIADMHLPFIHRNYLRFCKRIKKAYKPKYIVQVGDLVDNHAMSYHEHDPNGWSPADEMRQADKHLKKWFKAFPEVKLCRGNHDRLIDRKGKTVGLPERAFKNFRDIWNLPDGWEDDFQFEIGGVLYFHGEGFSGKYGHVTAAYDKRQSVVMGHLHSTAGVEYIANEKDIIFGMAVGCGIDRHSYAMAYGKSFRRKPILGCGMVEYTSNGVNATFLPMHM